MSKMNPVVHFEMPAEDRKRMADFYSNVFGWKAMIMGEDMGNYVVVQTTETDDKGMVQTPGAINGGFFEKNENSAKHPSVVISVDDINEAITKVNEGGGKVLNEPMEIPGVGMYASFHDTEGNLASLLQPLMRN